jgi:hypothetical protein
VLAVGLLREPLAKFIFLSVAEVFTVALPISVYYILLLLIIISSSSSGSSSSSSSSSMPAVTVIVNTQHFITRKVSGVPLQSFKQSVNPIRKKLWIMDMQLGEL